MGYSDNRHGKENKMNSKKIRPDELNIERIKRLEGMLEVMHSISNTPLTEINEREKLIQDQRIECQLQYKSLTGHYYEPTGKWCRYLRDI